MLVNNVSSSVGFNARLAHGNNEMKRLSLQMAKNPETAGLVEKIIEAFQKHPSDVFIKTSSKCKSQLYGIRGTIASRNVILTDVEPVSDNISGIMNIFRRILNPENKDCFNALVGKKHQDIYNSWWQENIYPIWDKIDSNFRGKTFYTGNFDAEFNKDFREQREVFWKKIFYQQ